MKTPLGFSYAGVNAGIKSVRKDMALVYSEAPCNAAGCFTVNKAKAAPVRDAEVRLPGQGMRAIVVNSGNANALTGAQGEADVQSVHRAAAAALGIDASQVLSASTGVIGVPLRSGSSRPGARRWRRRARARSRRRPRRSSRPIRG